VFDNLVKFVYKLDKNWQIRAWDPVFKTAGSAPDAAMILYAPIPNVYLIRVVYFDHLLEPLKCVLHLLF
jgi:hypothetical protein